MRHVSDHTFILHTYGLGDAVMLWAALSRLSSEDLRSMTVLTNQRSVYDYFNVKRVDVKFESLSLMILRVLNYRVREGAPRVIRSAAGTPWKNHLLWLAFRLWSVTYEWRSKEQLSVRHNTFRAAQNLAILRKFFPLPQDDQKDSSARVAQLCLALKRGDPKLKTTSKKIYLFTLVAAIRLGRKYRRS